MDIEKRIYEIEGEYGKKIGLACDEYHAHSYLRKCYTGDPDALMILRLCQVIRILLNRQRDAKRELSDQLDSPLTF